MSAPRIPSEIEALALSLAQEQAERAAKARTLEGAEEIAMRLKREASTARVSVKAYIEALTKNPEGVEPPKGTTPTSAFWSYGVEHPDAPENLWGQHFLDNRYIAEAWAQLQEPGTAQTLETSDAGRRLNEMYLFESEVLKALGGAEHGFTDEWTRECWANLSETYAAAAKGPVAVFAQYADTRSILYSSELPTLHTNGDVGLDNIHFAYESPDSWPKEVRDEVGTNAARAQLQYNDPTKPHYVDPKAYSTQDPAQRAATLDAEFAAVTAERNERAAEKRAAEQSTTATAEPEPQQTTEQTVEQAAETEAQPTPNAQAEADAETQPAAKTQAEPETQAEPREQSAAPSAAVPIWQLGFTPKPVINPAAASTSAAHPTAPPPPDLAKQATGPEL
ncbi:hypothetical protein [Streptomyces caniscabiei]|uniref:hypothetical protein n=1 Tax=Streptomyces caniscabiei TaxID=2746961 RepID=UPI0007659E5C|nr:hypothetical protein [Streptomyces caniscabiei]